MPRSCDPGWGPTRGTWDPGGGGDSAGDKAAAGWPLGTSPRHAAALARSETLSPLLPCGLTEEELAAITASAGSRSASGELAAAEGSPFSWDGALPACPACPLDQAARPPASFLNAARMLLDTEHLLTFSTCAGRTPSVSPPRHSAPAAAAGTIPAAQPQAGTASFTVPVDTSLQRSPVPAQARPGSEARPGAGRPPDDPRRSFERVNRVAAAVAAEKARRRSLEQQRRREGVARARSQHHHLAAAEQLRVAVPPRRRAGGPLALLLGRQGSASEGQLDALLGPPTPRGSVEGVTAAARLAAISPDPCAHLPASTEPSVTDTSAQHAAPGTPYTAAGAGPPRNRQPNSQPKHRTEPAPVRSSAPPSGADAAWREQLRHHLRLADADGRGSAVSGGSASSSSSRCSATPPSSPFGQRGHHAPDPELRDGQQGPAGKHPGRPSTLSMASGPGTPPQPLTGPTPGNYTSFTAASPLGDSSKPSLATVNTPCDANDEPATPRRKKCLLSAVQRMQRMLRL
jgi:hypothetical protein